MARRLTLIVLIGMVVIGLTLGLVDGVRSYQHIHQQFSNLGRQNAMLGAEMARHVIEKSIDNGLFEPATVFSRQYRRIGETDPPRYRTDYDYYFDRNVNTMLEAFLLEEHIYYALIVNNDGYVPSHTDPALAKIRIESPTCSHEGGTLGTIRANAKGQRFYEFHAHIAVHKQPWGEFRVGIPVALVNNAVRATVGVTLLITVVLAGIVVGVIFVLVRRYLGPLGDLTAATTGMASGDMTIRCRVRGRDELGVLADAFNAMAAKIEESHGTLEQLVRQRTNELEATNRQLQAEVVERGRAEEELRRNEQRLSLHVQQTPLGVIEWDTAFRVTQWNAAAESMFGYSREDAVGRHAVGLILPESIRGAVDEVWKALMAGQGGTRSTNENTTKDGRTILCDWYNTPLVAPDGTVVGVASLVQDITEQQKARRQLLDSRDALETANQQLAIAIQDANRLADEALQASRAKSEFLANMSHEIRTPMTAILGYTETLLDPGLSDQERSAAILTVRRNGEHLLSIINNILDLSKIEAGRMTVESVACSPCSFLNEVAAMVKVRADAKNIAVGIEYAGPVPETIRTDPTRLRQVLINLIGNAIKFTEVGSVRVVTQYLPGDVPRMQFDVIDTGIGMSREQMLCLFQPFSQADTSTARQFGGTGLGLAISRRFAQMLGGDLVLLASEAGGGSHFRVTVAIGAMDDVGMIAAPTVAGTCMPCEEPEASTPSLCCRILLAEDGPDNQRLISFVLKKAGADVTIAENGRRAAELALAALRDNRPFDVILMDMQMPVMDGYAAAGLLRSKGYDKPIIALTAHAMATDRDRCLDAGCDDYATKPIDRSQLLASVHAWATGERRRLTTSPLC